MDDSNLARRQIIQTFDRYRKGFQREEDRKRAREGEQQIGTESRVRGG